MTTVYLIRHAEAEGNIYRRCHGWYDSLITPNGYRQIEALRERFRSVHVDAVYSSDRFRTRTTAGAVYRSKGLTLHTNPGLREVGVGVWEDRPWGELHRRERQLLEAFNRADPAWQVEGSETYGGVQARMERTLHRIAAAHEGQTVAVFSHGAAIRTVLARFSGYPLDQIDRMPHGDNTAVTRLLFDGKRVEIDLLNDNSHLGELTTLGKQSWWKKEGGEQFTAHNLWFRPLELETEQDFYREARREAWETIHGTMRGFHSDGFWADAEAESKYDPNSVMVAMRGEARAGILQMDLCRNAEQGIGVIPFFYMLPEHRLQGLGVQLLGQAVTTYRPLDRRALRLRCAPENIWARRFYEKNGFHKVGEEPGGLGTLDLLEKYIGYEPL